MNDVICDKIVLDQRVAIYKNMVDSLRANTRVQVDTSRLRSESKNWKPDGNAQTE